MSSFPLLAAPSFCPIPIPDSSPGIQVSRMYTDFSNCSRSLSMEASLFFMKTAGMVMSSVPSPLIENGMGVLLGESLGEVDTDEGTGSRLSGERERA